MSISINEIVTGRKTFFITPDTSLFPESFLEDFFALGYECYFIEFDKRMDLRKKIDILLSVFNDVILFFNIDYNSNEYNWSEFIRSIMQQYQGRVAIGVLYTKRQSKEEKLKLEKQYLFDLGLQCGCIQLEYQKKQNFEIIEKILAANQAQGRRKNIRALCTNTCTYAVSYEGEIYNGVLQDISSSHFSFISRQDDEKKMELKSYEKLSDFHFNLKGFMFRSDAVMVMERATPEGKLYVFTFTSSKGRNGLDSRVRALLIPNIYQLMNSNFNILIHQLYDKQKSEENLNISDLEVLDADD